MRRKILTLRLLEDVGLEHKAGSNACLYRLPRIRPVSRSHFQRLARRIVPNAQYDSTDQKVLYRNGQHVAPGRNPIEETHGPRSLARNDPDEAEATMRSRLVRIHSALRFAAPEPAHKGLRDMLAP
jgi:hypothetical protein